MKTRFFTLILFAACAIAISAQQKKVAVYVMGADAGMNKVLGSKLVSAIARSEEYSAIERTAAFLAELSKEQDYQRTGAVDESELSRLGKQFGVQYVCVAAFTKAFDEDYITARLIDVESAQVERTASTNAAIRDLESLVYAANSLSTELLQSLGNERGQNSKKVAVYVIPNDSGKEIGRVLGDKLVAAFTNSGRYIAIERTNSFLYQLSKEQDYQRTGAVEDSDISRIGKQFGVQYVCVADVSEVFGEKFVSARLVDVETAEVVNSHDVGGAMNTMRNCLQVANEIADYLSKGTFKEQAEDIQTHTYTRPKTESVSIIKNYKLSPRYNAYLDISGIFEQVNGTTAGGFGLDVVNGVRFNKIAFLGLGVGLYGNFSSFNGFSWAALYTPIFADLRVFIPTKINGLYPYLGTSIGPLLNYYNKLSISNHDEWETETDTDIFDDPLNNTYIFNDVYVYAFFRLNAGLEYKRFSFGIGYELWGDTRVIDHLGFIKVGVRLGKNIE